MHDQKILPAANKCSLGIDYKQFIYIHPNISILLADAPQSVLEVFEDIAKNVVCMRTTRTFIRKFKSVLPTSQSMIRYVISGVVKTTNISFTSFQSNAFCNSFGHLCICAPQTDTHSDPYRSVTRRSGVFPQLQQVKYDCNKCGMVSKTLILK